MANNTNKFDKNRLRLEHIKSKGKPIEEFIEENEEYRIRAESYTPDMETMDKIAETLDSKNITIKIAAFGAEWCKDCKKHIPELASIISHLKKKGIERIKATVYSGIKTKPKWERKPGEVIWKSPPSPVEVEDPRFHMFHIPAFFIFHEDGKCLGKIDEHPTITGSMEGDIAHYLAEELGT